jgi:hypothetical protein
MGKHLVNVRAKDSGILKSKDLTESSKRKFLLSSKLTLALSSKDDA